MSSRNLEKQGEKFRQCLIDWFNREGRDFFWRDEELSAFQILLLEMMLKRTRAETIDQNARELISRFDTPNKVVRAEEEELKDMIKPFGLYNKRVKNLKSASKYIVDNLDGEVPSERDELMKIPGVADYIADAVLCFAFSRSVLVVDSNVAQVAEKYFDIEEPDDLRGENKIREKLSPLVPEEGPEKFNWALIDLGSKLRKEDGDPLEPCLSS